MNSEPENGYHYNVIARAIKILDEADRGALPLAELSARMGMSPSHFQRVFSQWAGVSPQRYQQYLTLQHARTLLRSSFSVPRVAESVGLSGSGRLHDLFLRWEAMSPGEYAKRGDGLSIRWGWFDSPFGEMLALGTARGICGMAFAAECGRDAAFSDMSMRWPAASFAEDPAPIADWVRAAPRGSGQARLHLFGPPFQVKVWEALLSIPSGAVTTYSEIARAIGKPTAVRAAGTAVGRNPVSWLIPCHRVLRRSGELGGYHWGLPVKRALLARESAQREAARIASSAEESSASPH